jgi:hypothetical protein
MTIGEPGGDFYGRIRVLTQLIDSTQVNLNFAPLGPIQRKREEQSIARLKAERIQVRAELRASKEKKPKSKGGG